MDTLTINTQAPVYNASAGTGSTPLMIGTDEFDKMLAEAAEAAEAKIPAEAHKTVMDGMGHLVDQARLVGLYGVPYDPAPYADFTDWFPQLAKETDFNALWNTTGDNAVLPYIDPKATPEDLAIVRELNKHDEMNNLEAVAPFKVTGTSAPPIEAAPPVAEVPAVQYAPETNAITPEAAVSAPEADGSGSSAVQSGAVHNYNSTIQRSYISNSGTAILMSLLEQETNDDDE
ncbi:MAG: hypothetical protein LBN97_05110 [Oscillospiraceae bacterium]|jgi:hypothetical protein|nr:hypothetical protein [Oscillospiraceae bacterium]